jgi:hypothetical protein
MSGCALDSADLKQELKVDTWEHNKAWPSPLASGHGVIYM